MSDGYWVFPNKRAWLVHLSYVTAYALVDLDEIVGLGTEDFLDLLCERALGTDLLQDVGYRPAGRLRDTLTFKVEGNVEVIRKVQGLRSAAGDAAFRSFAAVGRNLGWTDHEIGHAWQARGIEYRHESVIPLEGGRELHVPAFPGGCDYVRVVQTGLELDYWNIKEITQDQEGVIGAAMEPHMDNGVAKIAIQT